MKNFETILNTGEDQANYIQVCSCKEIPVVDYETLRTEIYNSETKPFDEK